MKKLIVVFLLLCSGVIYFIGSGCESADTTPSVGPTAENCTLVTVPKADFTFAAGDEEFVYFAGQTVTYKFTGEKGNGKFTFLQWTLPGTDKGSYFSVDETSVSVVYPLVGWYTVSLKVYNSCWSDRKIMAHYVRIM